MNLQIQQLAEQALEYAQKNQSADIPRHWFRLYNEKFADMIVRECAEIAKLTEDDDGDDYKSGRSWAGIDILKHFGVAE
jgi:hypothetical protein